MTKGVRIEFDMEADSLQVRTNSLAGSKEKVVVFLYNEQGSYAGGIYVKFYDPAPQYYIGSCSSDHTDFPVSVPSEQEKVWTFTEMSDGLKIYCNDVELVYYKFADATNNECVTYWSGDTTRISFSSSDDSASDSYRVAPGVCCASITTL